MEIPPQLLILLPLAVAAGVDLYLTLLVVGLAVQLGLGALGGPTISPAQGMPLLLGLAGLYVAEAAMESRPLTALLWHNLQLILRPLGGALLGLFLLGGGPWGFTVLGAAMGGLVAAFSHVLVWGQGLLLRIVPGQRLPPRAFNFAGDLAVVALLTLTLLRPDWGVLLATLLLLFGLVLGRNHHGVVRFGLTLLLGRAWAIVSPTAWKPGADLPAWIQKGIGLDSVDSHRGVPAATWGLIGRRRFKEGWILQKNQEMFFAFRRRRRAEFVGLDGQQEEVEVGTLSKTIQYRGSGEGPSALFLQVGLIGLESHK